MPEHLDFLRHGLTLHALACEASLLADNAARMVGVSVTDSIILTHQFLEVWKCGL
jgi:hypothetical protein